MIDGHGDDRYRYDGLVKMNFSTTVFQHADHSALKAYLADNMDVITNYPESQPRQLEKLIAKQLGITPESVLVTNGATEATTSQNCLKTASIGCAIPTTRQATC